MPHSTTVPVVRTTPSTIGREVRRTLAIARSARILMYPVQGALLLVPEDPALRRMVERNERILRRSGATVKDVLRELGRRRRARVTTRHARSHT